MNEAQGVNDPVLNTPVAASATPLLVVAGRCLIGQRPEQQCRAIFFAADGEPIVSGAIGRVGESVVCHLDGIGVLPGSVGPIDNASFILRLDPCHTRRDRVAARVAWHADRAVADGERRDDKRLVPQHCDVVIQSPDGRRHPATIKDLSKSGASFTLHDQVAIDTGMVLVVGKRYAVVVRQERNLIAVKFRLPFTNETFNPKVMI